MRRLQQAETIPALSPKCARSWNRKLVGWARANLDDMRAQLDALAHPGFREAPAAEMAEYPRWLKACPARRGAQRDPLKDQARMLEVKRSWMRWLSPIRPTRGAARCAGNWKTDTQQLFAQELGAKGGCRRRSWRSADSYAGRRDI